jgi:DNA-binding NtrC family response regulator
MGKQPGIETNRTGLLTVLSVSPSGDDHSCLEAIIGHSRWTFLTAAGLLPASAVCEKHDVSVVVCERDLRPGTWIDLLGHIERLSHPPSLIVTSRLADERLWAEALKLGAWDVLSKPFQPGEVLRSVKLAWEHWYHRGQMATRALNLLSEAS